MASDEISPRAKAYAEENVEDGLACGCPDCRSQELEKLARAWQAGWATAYEDEH